MDTFCELLVSEDKVQLNVDGYSYIAPIKCDKLSTLLVTRLDRFITHHPDGKAACEPDDLKLLGAVLFDLLCSGTATQLWRSDSGTEKSEQLKETLGEVLLRRLNDHEDEHKGEGAGRFRVALDFAPEAGVLANFPWEFLYTGDLQKGSFLGKRTTLFRVVRPEIPVPNPGTQLRVVVAWASPRQLNELTGASTMAGKIRTALKQQRIAFSVDEWPSLTWNDFYSRYKNSRMPPDILHIIAHGRLAERGELAFHWPEGELLAARGRLQQAQPYADVDDAKWTAVENLANLLSERPPRLVFLHACSSGRASAAVEAFRGAAEMIALAKVPFVIAMQYDIHNEDADLFAEKFYSTVVEPNVSVDEAVRAGRIALAGVDPAWGHRRFATPVVFLRDRAARLVLPGAPAPAADEAARGNAGVGPATLPCPFPSCREQVVTTLKRCGCQKRLAFAFCASGHPNDPADESCVHLGCDAPIRGGGHRHTMSGPPATAPLRTVDET